jgi:SnoaL-like domain
MSLADAFVIDHTIDRRGSIEEWVECFTQAWAGGARELETILGLLSPDVRLIAPGLHETVGIMQARAAFERTFAVLPDLTASVNG